MPFHPPWMFSVTTGHLTHIASWMMGKAEFLSLKSDVLVRRAGENQVTAISIANDCIFHFEGDVANLVVLFANRPPGAPGLSIPELCAALSQQSKAFLKSKFQAKSVQEAVDYMLEYGILQVSSKRR